MNISVWTQLSILITSLAMVAAKDYYETLGVKRDATDKDIKRRFRQLGKNIHDSIGICALLFACI